MELMLDTNICIYLIKEHPRSVLERFASHAVGDIGLSVMTLAELEYGVSKSSRPARNREALDQFISPLDVAPFDRQASRDDERGRPGAAPVRWCANVISYRHI